MAPRQTDDQPPGVPHHPARKGDQGEAHCLETLAHPLSAQHQPLHRRAQIEGQHRYGPPCGVGSEQPRRQPATQPGHSSERCGPARLHRISACTTGPPHLPQGLGWSPTRRPCARLRQPFSSRGRAAAPTAASSPGRGCSLSGSLMAMNRYSGLFLLCPIQSGYEVQLRPLLTCLYPGGAQPAVCGDASPVRQPRTRRA